MPGTSYFCEHAESAARHLPAAALCLPARMQHFMFVVVFGGGESVFIRSVIMILMLTIFLNFSSALFMPNVVYHVTEYTFFPTQVE